MKEQKTSVQGSQEPQTASQKLTEAFSLWKNTSKSGNAYLSGKDLHGNKLVAFFNSKKENPKEPDVRVYEVDSDGKAEKEVASLWESISKAEKPYLTGKTTEKEKLIAFYDEVEKHPYIKAYFKE